MAEWLDKILAKEEIYNPIIIGQSMGGYLAQMYMELYPDKIKGFISIDSAPLQKSYMTAVEIWLLERAEPLYKIYPWKVLLRAGSRGCAETDYGQNLMRKMMMSYDSDPEEYARLAGFGYRMLAEAIKADLPYHISCPALLICGEKDKAGSAKSYNKKWHQREGLPLKWIKNAGHNSNTDQPEEENRNFVIDRRKKNIVYTNRQGGEQKKWQYNTLEVPRGAEYELILADGTHVWLNADTRLRYPTCFNTDERRVYLEGEAYFQVTKDTAHPFRVESEAQVVEVLGTQLNVYAYGHEERTYTTLVEGKVAVTASASGQHVQLMPGQQASLGRQGGEIVVGEVNIQQVVDWKNGMFVFDDLSLEAILRKVARWYDVEVFYRNQQAKAIVFKGNLPRYGELPELLKVLENSSEVHFSLKGNTLIVE